MVDEAIAEKASDVAKCKCVATAPQCPTPQQRNTQYEYLLRTLAVCGECGWRMECSRAGSNFYYRCRHADRLEGGPERTCTAKRVRRDDLDGVVWDAIRSWVQSPRMHLQEVEAWRTSRAGAAEATREQSRLEAAERRLREQVERLVDAYQRGAISVEELKARRERLEASCDAVRARVEELAGRELDRARIDRLGDDLEAFAATLRMGLDNLDFQGRQRTRAVARQEDRGHRRQTSDRARDPTLGPFFGVCVYSIVVIDRCPLKLAIDVPLHRGHEMNPKKTIELNAIQKNQEALEALPPYEPKELTKAKAIGLLITQIRAAQSKGYSLAAIARMLSERGIPITTSALRATLSDAKPAGARKRKRKTKSAAEASTNLSPDATGTAASREKPAATEVPAAQAKANVASVTRTVDLDWDPAAPSEKLVQEQGAARRQVFHVRPDRKNI